MRSCRSLFPIVGLLPLAIGCAARQVPAAARGPAAVATSDKGPPITRTLVGRVPAHAPGWETRLYVITYAPGAVAPLHVHPAKGVGWVIEGELESAFGDQPVLRVQAGGAFVDEAEVVHRVFRNPSHEHVLRFAIAYTLRTDEENFRLVELSP